jgi:aminopeptidase
MSISDPRIKKQAEILIDHSLKVKKGERVVVIGDYTAKPLMLEIYKTLINKGALDVKLRYDSYEIAEIFYKYATNEQLIYFPQIDLDEMKYFDCYLRIVSSVNTRGLTNVDAEKISRRSKILKPISDFRVEKMRWCVTRFPTEAQAQEADMSLSDYEDFVFTAINKVNWKKKFREQEKLRKLLDKTKKVRLVAADTDLILKITGRRAENGGGEFNMPDGEVFTSVVEDSPEGIISYSYPAIYLGREFNDVRLEFKKGKVVSASASKNEKDLYKILDMDKGARYIGELGIGNNFQINKFTKDILFDEKIGGSIHIALGKGYKETLSKNESALHWDMIKDLRFGGQIWFDDKLVQKDGKWVIRI